MGELIIIFGFIIVAALIVFSSIRSIVNRQLEHKERMAAAATEVSGVSDGAYKRLEERVRVLERIATEKRSDLAAQIEQLRDLDIVEDFTASRERAQ